MTALMDTIKPTCDRKTKFWGGQKNTFGLLPGREHSCPEATIGEGGCMQIPAGRKLPVCYVHPLMRAYPGIYSVLAHNTFVIKNASQNKMTDMLVAEIQRFKAAEMRRDKPSLFYRFHWSGDVFSQDYAEAIRRAVEQFPEITFWIYTRSTFAVETLSRADNMSVYMSIDPDNAEKSLAVFDRLRKKYPERTNIQIAYMSKENNFNDAYGDQYPHKLSACPNDTGRLPTDYACSKCQKCLGTRTSLKPIWFKC